MKVTDKGERKIVLTYGTFDLLHLGHERLLKRARALGDYLIVGVTTEEYDRARGKINVVQSTEERKAAVARLGYADLIIEEKEEGQKIQDIRRYGADIVAFGSDWEGKFDYLKKYCDVIYLERTKGISSSILRKANGKILALGVVGCGRIARRMIAEAHFVSGQEITSVFGRNRDHVQAFADELGIADRETDFGTFLRNVDAVYIALPHHLHTTYAKRALLQKKHVLCEKPMALSRTDAEQLYSIAKENGCVLMEAFKTLYAPAFQKILALVRGGAIGNVRSVDASFTKLVSDVGDRVYAPTQAGGAFCELGSYPVLAISQFLGQDYLNVRFTTLLHNSVDVYTRAYFLYQHSFATATVGIGAKREGDLIIAGTEGSLVVPAPWWKTDYFEIHREDTRQNSRHYVSFDGDGLRYELAEFVRLIKGGYHSPILRENSLFIAQIMQSFLLRQNTDFIT